MNKIDFRTALLFAPLAYAAHHFEEHVIFNFRAWRLEYFSDNNPLPTETVFLVLTAITLVYLILHALVENKASAQSVILFLMATQVANTLFHAGGTVVFWHFSPGLITALVLYVPTNALIVRKALAEEWVTKSSLGVLFLVGSLQFALFETFGPAPMVSVLLATYIWIGYTHFSQKAD
jgi:hypothetical protein